MGLLVNLVEFKFREEDRDKIMPGLLNNAHNAVDEPGCHQFDVTVSKDDPNRVVLYEVYDDEAALDAHRQQQYFKDFFAVVTDLGDRIERNARLFEVVS